MGKEVRINNNCLVKPIRMIDGFISWVKGWFERKEKFSEGGYVNKNDNEELYNLRLIIVISQKITS